MFGVHHYVIFFRPYSDVPWDEWVPKRSFTVVAEYLRLTRATAVFSNHKLAYPLHRPFLPLSQSAENSSLPNNLHVQSESASAGNPQSLTFAVNRWIPPPACPLTSVGRTKMFGVAALYACSMPSWQGTLDDFEAIVNNCCLLRCCYFWCFLGGLIYTIVSVYIMAVIWCMKWDGESLSLHFYRLKGSLTSNTI